MEITFRKLQQTDWEQVANIYKEGIATGMATFETKVPNWKDWNEKQLHFCRIVAAANSTILGWIALSAVSSRDVYKGVAEVSVYVSKDFRGHKIGTKLLEKVIIESEAHGIWTLQSGIFPENLGSIKMHKNLGFREIGYREKIGKINDLWKDNILLERRSKKVGI